MSFLSSTSTQTVEQRQGPPSLRTSLLRVKQIVLTDSAVPGHSSRTCNVESANEKSLIMTVMVYVVG